jgi:hypothetical protein
MDSENNKSAEEETSNSKSEENQTKSESCCETSGPKTEKCCSAGSSAGLSELFNLSKLDYKWIGQKVQDVMLNPSGCWDKIKAEALAPKELYSKYLFPLALLASICSFLGASVVGISFGFGTFRVPFFSGLIFQIATLVVSLLGYAVMALIIEKLSPKFNAQVSFERALLLVGFSATPGLLAGIFSLFPSGLFAAVALVLSIYSLYLLWSGFGRMVEVAADKKIAFFATSVVCSIIAIVLLNLVTTSLFGPKIPAEFFDQKQFEESIKQLGSEG